MKAQDCSSEYIICINRVYEKGWLIIYEYQFTMVACPLDEQEWSNSLSSIRINRVY